MLDEAVQVTGYHRKVLIRLLGRGARLVQSSWLASRTASFWGAFV